jgi:hypothetical protein
MRRASLLTLLAVATTTAQAAPPACIERGDMRTLIRVALPSAVEALTARCKATLPPDAFLPSEGAALAERYRQEAPADPARARKAIEAATGRDLSSFADDDTVVTLARAFIGNAIDKKVKPGDCHTIDGMVALAAPFHAGAMADAILLGLELAGPDVTRGLAICRPSAESAPR